MKVLISTLALFLIGGFYSKAEAGIRNPGLFAVTIPVIALTFGVIGYSFFSEPDAQKEIKSSEKKQNHHTQMTKAFSALELQAISRHPSLRDIPIPPR